MITGSCLYSEAEQEKIAVIVNLLKEKGIKLGYPYSSNIENTEYRLRELRIQYKGNPYRILYAFDAQRAACLLIGGNKTKDKNWYEKLIPKAERLYIQHIEST